MPGGGAVVDGRFIDENIRRAIDETLQKKGVQPAAAGATPDIYISYSTRAEGASSQDRVSGYVWWSGLYETSTKYRQGGTLWINIRDSQRKLIWRGLKSALLGTNPDALRRDIEQGGLRASRRVPAAARARRTPPPGTDYFAACGDVRASSSVNQFVTRWSSFTMPESPKSTTAKNPLPSGATV